MKLNGKKRKLEPVDNVESSEENEASDESNVEVSTKPSVKQNRESGGLKQKKRMKFSKDLYKAPTVEELNQLRETENLFNSNLFRLQIEEILKEIKVNDKKKTFVNSWFEKFQAFISSLDDSKVFDLSNLHWMKKLKVNLPLDDLPASSSGFFKFMKPVSINIVGLYRIDCCIAPNLTIDIDLVIPYKCFHKSDIANARYILKRAIYLSYIASKLRKSKLFEEIMFSHENGNNLKPVIKMKIKKDIWVTLHTIVEGDMFKLSKLNPSKNKIQAEWFFGNNDEIDTSTPFYNSCVLSDLVARQNDELRFNVINEQSNIQDGIRLLNVWLKQRNLESGFGAFTSDLISMFVVYLLKNKKLNNAMSSYQVIRNVWLALAHNDWCDNEITLSKSVNNSYPTMNEFKEHFDVVFVDTTGYYNLASSLYLSIYKYVKKEAERAVTFLDNGNFNSFQALFMAEMPFYRQMDQILQIKDDIILNRVWEVLDKNIQLDYTTFKHPAVLKSIVNVLTPGLNNRVDHIIPKIFAPKSWELCEIPPDCLDPIIFGLKLNEKNAFTILEKGPEANLPEAELFRKFWGSKSQLRRFQDGSITEAIVWTESTCIADKRSICKSIVTYLLDFKLSIPKSAIHYFDEQFTNILKRNNIEVYFEYGTGEEATLQTISCFDDISKELRGLKDLPLEINAVQGISPVFRSTEVNPLISTTHSLIKHITTTGVRNQIFQNNTIGTIPPYVKPLECVIQLSLSGKWPNNLEAIKRLKAAFLIKIATSLYKQHKLPCAPCADYVDILRNGFVFRLYVAHNKEIGLMKKTTSEEGITVYRDTHESLEAEKTMIHLPKITSALQGLNSQYPSFSSASRLAKRWIRGQLLDESHIPEIVIDLLMATIYLSPEPYTTPTLPQIAFLRFLNKISSTNWNIEPVIINFNSELDKERLMEIETLFTQNRSTLPALFITTSFEERNSIWTKRAPNDLVLSRLGFLSKEFLKLLESNLYINNNFNFKALFQPSLTGYDVIIHLNEKFNPRFCEALNCTNNSIIKIKSYQSHPNEKIPIVDFDPIQYYLKEIRNAYDDVALFFHDSYGGNSVCVLWKPSALDEIDFKVSHINGRQLIAEETPKLKLNIEAILEDFFTLGEGLVDKVERCK